jgi:tripartite-type tricarboxylate transporter receptor subunit TctC
LSRANHSSRAFTIAFAIIAATLLVVLHARAQTYPDRTIKLVVPYPPGGPSDTTARVSIQNIAAHLGQNMIIENEAGAGGRIGTRAVARATADGYTLLFGGSNENAITPALYKKLDYDPVKDFVAVAPVATDSNAVVVNPSVPVQSLAELVQYAKDHPGKLSSGATLGISPHLLLEFIRERSGIDVVFVPYKGAAPGLADTLGGQIQIYASNKSVLLPLIKSGRLRGLAVTSAERWPELPDVPTLRESGFDGFPTAVWYGLMAPAATPPAVIAKLNAATTAAVNAAETKSAVAKIGLQSRTLSAAEFGDLLGKEVQLWDAVARAAHVSLD